VEYQPVVRLDGSWIGMEALVRWQHPDLGLLGPGEFIPLAEESGLIEPLGLWVLENALAATARWKDQWAEASDFCICVNISARQLVPGFAERVVDAIRRHGVPPEAVVLEMTESVLMERAASEYAVLAQLREYGVRIAIDDFGTGYSSLSYLVRLPVDIVKLDRSFTSGLVASSREASVVRALTGLVRDLELDLIAEGVEHADQVEALRGLGCHLAQGWYYDRSLPEAEVHRRLGAR
jgi:EAL domain-containing protein (putative c-di-GMP-specific phosphodiesterase class I)